MKIKFKKSLTFSFTTFELKYCKNVKFDLLSQYFAEGKKETAFK